MSSRRRIVPLAWVMATGGCFNPENWRPYVGDESTTSGTSNTEGTGDGGPISTVTSGGSSDGSGSDGASSSSGGEGSTTGELRDAAPTISLEMNGSSAPAMVVQASAQSLTAFVGDDRGLDRVAFFLDEETEAFAEVALAGETSSIAHADLMIHDALFNGSHSVRAVVYDDMMQTTSAAISFKVALPAGGTLGWRSVIGSKFAARALFAAPTSSGDVIAVGEVATSQDGLSSRMMIRKHRAGDGKVLWERMVPTLAEGTPSWRNVAHGVTVDEHDNVYVVGAVRPGAEESSLWVGKYTHDGLLAATFVSDTPRSRGNGVAVASGQIFVVGYFVDDDMKAAATLNTFDVGLKPIPGGNDTIEILGAVETYAYGVAIDRQGDVVVVGSAALDNNTSQGLIALYTPKGTQKWARVLEPEENEPLPLERLFSVSVDADNRYVAVGKRLVKGDKRRLWQVRIDAAGNELASTIDLAARCGDEDFEDDTETCGVAIGPLDRTHFAGVLPNGSDDYLVKRTKAEWAVLTWETADDGPDHATDRGLAVAVDTDGFVISAGYHTAGGLPRWHVARQNP